MADDKPTTPLTRRVPGAARSGPERSKRPVLPDALIERMQAAVDAARGTETPAANATQGAPDRASTDRASTDRADPEKSSAGKTSADRASAGRARIGMSRAGRAGAGMGRENPEAASGSDESPEPITEPRP